MRKNNGIIKACLSCQNNNLEVYSITISQVITINYLNSKMTKIKNLHSLRKDYGNIALTISTSQKDPFKQFEKWFKQSLNAKIYEPNAFILSTANKKGVPSSRVVLLKKIDSNGFYFFTNYSSQKGKEILENPTVSMVFFWPEIHRQIRITGKVKKISREESKKYFFSRPLGSQIGAIISPQSSEIESEKVLATDYNNFLKSVNSKKVVIDCPKHWGGYCIKPIRFEFWQGKSNRLHDRLVYKSTSSSWKITRLAP